MRESILRAYRFHDGAFWQLTEDHTAVGAMVTAGTLQPDQARTHPLGHILSRAVGTEEALEVDVLLGVAEPGDRFLLCSDGLIRMLKDDELEERLLEAGGWKLEDRVRDLVEAADLRGAPDNVTVAILALD